MFLREPSHILILLGLNLYKLLGQQRAAVLESFEQIIKNGAAKNYNNDEAYYYQEKAKSEANSVESWKKRNIFWPQENNKALEKEILKTRKKLEAIVNQ